MMENRRTRMQEIEILGVRIHLVGIEMLNDAIRDAVHRNARLIIAGQNLHGVYLYHVDAKRKAYCDLADIVRVDGMALLLWAKFLGYSVYREQRITFVDWLHPLMATAAAERWRVFYLGGKPGVAARAAEKLRRQYSGLVLETRHGYFTPEENDAVLEEIARFQPHVLMVGMGMPRQEHWVLDNLERISANAILTVGACFDYVAGVIPTPPRWMGRMGLEWLYRLWSEPRRLARRYLLEPWFLVPLALKDLTGRFRKITQNEQT
jgi:N-acetylglucosaminyldiphosphoundecaprenol N-acetyl-beta-D-mannosaminyltransferase